MMKLIFSTVLALAAFGSAFNLPEALARFPNASGLVEETQEKVRKYGCDPNICFALDGSGSISRYEWNLQKDFVNLVAAVISADPQGTYGAVQYGLGLRNIGRFQTANYGRFALRVDQAKHQRYPRTFIAPAIGNCIRKLDRFRYNGEPKKIVLLGDGRSNFDSRSWPLSPASIVKRWTKDAPNKKVCAVAVRWWDTSAWNDIVGEDHVFKAWEWLEVIDVMEHLVRDICGWDDLEF